MKKSQIQLGESTAVVIIIIVFIFLGLVIYFQFWKADQTTKNEEQREILAIELATKVSYLPEPHCTFQGTASSNCYDKIKLEFMNASRNNTKWRNYYYDYFGYAKIEMTQVYPYEINYILYENQKDELSQSGQPVFIPSRIYNSLTDTYAFAYLTVTKYT